MTRFRHLLAALFTLFVVACGGRSQSLPPQIPTAAVGAPDLTEQSVPATSTKMGIAHIFDQGITASTVAAFPNRYDIIWGSFNPDQWRSSNAGALLSRYYLMPEDNVAISGHGLAWWQANHPDWILYACTPSGAGTRDIAYTPGVGFADVPLDLHNPAAVAYQQRTSLIPYVLAHNYNAIALDEVLLSNMMEGGNPKLGQSVISGYYGCGVWKGGTFVRRYASKADPAWAADVIAWVKSLHTILKTDAAIAPHKLSLIINHPAAGINTNEEQLLANTDVDLNETGYSDYGYYTDASKAGLYLATHNWSVYAQQHGVHVVTVDKYTLQTTISANQADYALATYYTADMGASSLVIAGHNYNTQPYYSQFATSLGSPCGPSYGGPAYDALSPHLYYRRFSGGMVVVNSGSLPILSEIAHLPLNHIYHDVMGRVVTNPLVVPSSDGFTLTTTSPACS